jgi:autotransporter translocation and assembly factor TamB
MKSVRVRRTDVLATAVLAVVVFIALLAKNAFAAWLIARIAGASTGTVVAIGSADVGLGGMRLSNVTVASRAREPIARIGRISVTYDLRDAITKSGRLYGLKTLDVVRPQITLIHHADGTFNIPIPKSAASAKPGPPLIVRGSVVDGSVTGIEQLHGSGPPLRITNVRASFDLDTASASTYNAGLVYHESGRSYPIDGTGAMDARANFAMHHWVVPEMPIARLANFAIGNPNVRLISGRITGANVRAFTLHGANGVVASTLIRHVAIASPSLASPVQDLSARLDIGSQAALFEGMQGSLAGMPLHGSGGVYDLTNPHLRFALGAQGDLARVKSAFVQARRLPISGVASLRMLAQGPASAPLVTVAVTSREITYLRAPIRNITVLAAAQPSELDVIGANANYAGFAVDARGRIAFVSRPNDIELLARAFAPADRVPYAADIVPGMPLAGTLLATADDPRRIETHGVVNGQADGQRLAAMFAVSSAGTGTVGPLVLNGSRGNLYATIALNHPSGDQAAFVDARGLRIDTVNVPPLPGFPVPALPPLHAILDAHLLGTLDNGQPAAIGTVRVRGSLATLNAFLPQVRARGGIDAPLRLLFASNRAVVQADDALFSHASIAGVPLDAASATVALAPHAIHVFAADVRAGNARLLASQSAANGPIALIAQGVPLLGGSVSAAGLMRADQHAPTLSSTLLAQNVRYDGIPISAMSSVAYENGTLGIGSMAVGAGAANLGVAGTVRGLAVGAPIDPRYDLDAQVRAADVHALAMIVQPSRAKLVGGTVDAQAHIGGSGAMPRVVGTLDAPEGNVNGLAFTDLHGALDATPQRIAFSHGGVTVGTTNVTFNGDYAGGSISGAVSAPHANLADFDDFFDTGGTLGGRGSIDASFGYEAGAIQSAGNLNLADLRYQRLTVGNTYAAWSTTGRQIALAAIAHGQSGTLQTSGTVDTRSHAIDLAMSAQRMNLSSWLPALGINEPVTGYLDANGTASGRFPNINSAISAAVTDGTLGPYPLQRGTIALHTTGGRGRIDAATVQVPYLTANASGTFGFHPSDALAVVAQIQSPDIGSFVSEGTGRPNQIGGSLNTTLNVSGTPLAPVVSANAQLAQLRYANLTIPRVIAQGSYARRMVTVSDAEADFQRGRIVLAGTAPVSLTSLSATMTADDLELANFAALLPQGTNLAGRIDGTVRASGSPFDPALNGLVTLASASYSGPQLSTPITGGAQLALAGRAMRLQNATFATGGGTVNVAASAIAPSWRDPNAATLNLQASANGVTIDAPKYYKGRIDGAIAATRAAGAAPVLSGNVTVSSARMPATAFIPASGSGTPAPPIPLAFKNFTLAVGNDVRVQSPNVDVGAKGSMTLNGTLAKMTPSGKFVSTGGTVSFYRTFRVQHATVSFSPDSGIIPDIDALATTSVSDPSYTEIGLHVTGPASNMNLAFSSNPPYDRSQILALLAGVGSGTGTFTAGGAATSLAAGQINTLFTRNLLEPLSTALQSTLGFANVQLTSDIAGGSYGARFVRAFGRNLHAIFNESFGYPERTSFELEATPNEATAVRFMAYTQPSAVFLSQPPSQPLPGAIGQAALLQQLQLSGTNGFSIMYERRYWSCPPLPQRC